MMPQTYDNQQNLIKDTHAQVAVERDTPEKNTTAERAASVEQKQRRQTEHLACVDKQECDNRMFVFNETWFN